MNRTEIIEMMTSFFGSNTILSYGECKEMATDLLFLLEDKKVVELCAMCQGEGIMYEIGTDSNPEPECPRCRGVGQ